MGSGIHVLGSFGTCSGQGLLLGRPPALADRTGPPVAETSLTLASLLCERDAQCEPAASVVLRIANRDDAAWATEAIPWLLARGRRVIVRTAVVMPRPLVDAAREHDVTVLLELADPRPKLQRALLGAAVDPAAALLLHAQHLRSLGVEVAAQVGPLMPIIHAPGSLLAHVVAADLGDAHLSVARLSPMRFAALAEAVPWAQASAVARAFEVGTGPTGEPLVPATGARLPAVTHFALYHEARRRAESLGIRVDHCGCPAQCHLARTQVGDYVALTTPDLFSDVG